MKVEMAVVGSPSLIVLIVSVAVKQHKGTVHLFNPTITSAVPGPVVVRTAGGVTYTYLVVVYSHAR